MAVLDVRVIGSAEGMPVRYVYEFRSTSAEGTGPLEQEYSADVSPALVQDLCVKIDGIIEGARGSPDTANPAAELAQFGGLLFQTLFPRAHGSIPDLVTRLGREEGPLLIRTNEWLIPWELLHDGQGFFALRHELGRRSFVDRRVVGGRTIGTIGRALIVGDPMDDLALARREAEHLAAWLTQRGTACTVLLGSQATLLGVVGELASGKYDLLHYCGHIAVPYGTTDVGLVLHDRELLDERALHPLSNVGVPPLVFINGCSSAARLANLCVSFMVMGAKAVVGTRYEVGEKGPQRFAELFYADLMEGVSAGAAVRTARHSLLRASDIDWTSFVLYADPAVRVAPGEREPTKMAPQPRQLQEVEGRLNPQAIELMRRVVGRAKPRGVATSVDLLTELLSAPAVQKRLAVTVGAERLALADELLHALLGNVPAKASDGEVAFSDTVTSVLAQAELCAAKAGRHQATVDDVVSAFAAVGGGTAARVLDLFGISLAELTERDEAGMDGRPPREQRPSTPSGNLPDEQPDGLFGADGRLCMERLDPAVVVAIRAAVLLAAVRGAVMSTSALLVGFGITDNPVLRESLEQGMADASVIRRLASPADVHRERVSVRTRRVLERAAAAAGSTVSDAAVLREILSEPDSSARALLDRLKVDPDRLLSTLPQPQRRPRADGT